MTDLERLRRMLARNEVLVEVLGRARELDLPQWYLAAGCVAQTAWNVLTGREPGNPPGGAGVRGSLCACGRPPRVVVRPNPVLAPRGVFERKAARWRNRWPELVVVSSEERGTS